MKNSRLLFLIFAALLATGCDPSEDGADTKSSSSSQPSSQSGSAAATTPQELPESAQRLTELALGPAVPADGETAAQWGQASFDGNGRTLGSLDSSNLFASVVYAGDPSTARHQALALSAPRRIRVSGDAVPSPSVPSDGGTASRKPHPVLSAFEAAQKTAYETVFPILSRLDWGARAARPTNEDITPYRITVHHTDGQTPTERGESAEQMRNMQSFHQRTRGWADIGYHFVIDGSGRILEGRPVGVLGAHSENANDGNIGIALMGNFEKERPTPQQVESLERLGSFLAARYNIDPSKRFDGHRHYGQTDCPGRYVVELLARMREEIADRKLALLEGSRDTRTAGFEPLLVTHKA
ncbi:MAG: peptidoglycan recognition protein [Elusimicrobiota bacterium]|jgi:hypothetical protein